MIKKGSLYSASDKAFFDALCQHKMTKPALQELLWRRGIIKSNDVDKEDIAKHFSRIEHDYFDHKLISEKVTTGSNREKQTPHFLNTSIDLKSIESIAKELVVAREKIDNKIDFSMSEKSITIELSYSYYDHNRPEFKQLVTKNALISIESSDEGISIRAPDNAYVSEITSTILSKIENKSDQEFDIDTINLYGVDNVISKIDFFRELIGGLEEMDLYDVSDVAVYNPDTGEEDQLGVHVKRASLNGEGVFQSGELNQFYKKGFFVYRISWSSKEKNNPKSDIYNFHAQFNDPDECRKFSYLVKGVKRFLANGSHAKSPSNLSSSVETRMMRRLEKSARRAKIFVFNPKTTEVSNEESEK